ncbi:MAG TPA: DEAD/DEAH box helicase, partial [Polyangia bacterium]
RPPEPFDVPPPPAGGPDLIAWAETHGVVGRLDDVIIGGDGPLGTYLPARHGEVLTYRNLLLDPAPPLPPFPGASRRRDEAAETARRYLHRIAALSAEQKADRAFLEAHGKDPEDEVLASFHVHLVNALRELVRLEKIPPRPAGTFDPGDVVVTDTPLPMLRYEEWPLAAPRALGGLSMPPYALLLLGWNEGPLRWQRFRHGAPVGGEPTMAQRQMALGAFIDFLRDPRVEPERAFLAELLRMPAWQFALGSLDERLSRLPTPRTQTEPVVERIAFRVSELSDGVVNIEPLVQKRSRGGAYSKGARTQWYNLPDRPFLTDADRRAYNAYDDRFARRSAAWGGLLAPAQVFGILRALIDHPAVFLEGEAEGVRLDIRLGRLRLRFANAPDGGVFPQFELMGKTMLASEVARALRDDAHLILIHKPEGAATQVLLAEVTAQAAAIVRALAIAPARFPPEAHDALATRLESLQETVDIEFPSQWTRTIAAADGRLLARLELLVSGAVQMRLGVRPAKLGPVFPPGEGPALVLEGQGADRHGVRRDRQQERQQGHALAERLGLDSATSTEPWNWRVTEGDPALHVVATLKEMADEVTVEWADDARLLSLGSVGRRDLRMRVADKRDWFSVEGGATVAGAEVRLADLFAAIREGRRYLPVGKSGFVRIEETLRAALERAEGAAFETRGLIQIAAVASDPLRGLVEEESQIEADAAFARLRRRMREGEEVEVHLPVTLAETLRPYQKAGVQWLARLAHWGAGAVLADEMGLGKTIQTLAVLSHRASLGPALVVAPTSVVPNWLTEAARFVPGLRVRLYRGPGRAQQLKDLGPGDLLVTSYAITVLDAEALARLHFASVVLDEAQAVKNAGTERAKALRDLSADWRLGLSGTPIENHLGELWSLFRVISPGLLGSWEQFRGRYSIPIEKFGDDGRRRTLATLIRPFVLRRTKSEVAPELPERTEIMRILRLSPEEQSLYEQLRRATLKEIEDAKKNRDRDGTGVRMVVLAALTRLRQLCCHPRLVYPDTSAGSTKAAYLTELLAELREGGHKALVFSQFRSFLDLLAPRLRQHGFRVLVLDGTTSAEARQQRIDAFQAGAADVFLISLKAGGFGLNLTAADTVIHLDPWWNPAVEDQATARAHRIGQRKPVTAVRLVARGTVEEAVLGLHETKRALASAILEGTEVAATLSVDELMAMIRQEPSGSSSSSYSSSGSGSGFAAEEDDEVDLGGSMM